MSDANGFFQLQPKGVRRDQPAGSPGCVSELATVEQIDKIETLRFQFLASCGMNSDRPLVRYKRLLNKVDFVLHMDEIVSPDIVEAVLCDRSTLFSPAYAEQQQNHQIARESRAILGKTARDQQESALKWATASFERDRSEQAEQFRDILVRLDACARSRKKNISMFAEELDAANREADDGEEAQRMLERLRNWIPEIPLDLDEVPLFHRCLSAYARHIHDQQLVGKIAGHYQALYSADAYRMAEQYDEQRRQLRELRIAAEKERAPSVFPFEYEAFGGAIFSEESPLEEDQMQLLQAATQQYFSEIRTTVSNIRPEAVNAIASQVLKRNQERFPFRYLVTCIVGSGGLFSRMAEVSCEAVMKFPEQVYRAKPSREKQRLARMRLMDALCRTMKLKNGDLLENWRLFWWYHGRGLESQSEVEEWARITARHPIELPTVAYGAQCFAHIEECLKADPSTLFSYESCSKWHLGGFFELVEKNAGLELVLSRSTISAKKRSEYLALWAEPQRDRDKIRTLCKREISKMNWMRIGEIIEDSESLESQELKALLTEYAIRLQLVNDAKERLRKIVCTQCDRMI